MSVDPRRARARGGTGAAATAQPTPPPPPPAPAPVAPSETTSQASLPSLVDGPAESTQASKNGGSYAESHRNKLKFCTVCASNNNRSMEGHIRLAEAKYPVISFGTGSLVRLPGPSINQPNIYNFNSASYDQMYRELETKDPRLYRANGILNMLERNRAIKWGPERWQDWKIGEPRVAHERDQGWEGSEGGVVDVVVTCEERCWDAVVDDLLSRGNPMNRPVHIFNVDIKDSHEEALIGGKAIVDLADSLNNAADEARDDKGAIGWSQGSGPARQGFDAKIPDILADWQERWPQFPSLWTLAWF